MSITEGSKKRSISPVINEETINEKTEKEYENDLKALQKLPPEEQPGSWKSSWRLQMLERRRVEAKYEALRDITRDLRTKLEAIEKACTQLKTKRLNVRVAMYSGFLKGSVTEKHRYMKRYDNAKIDLDRSENGKIQLESLNDVLQAKLNVRPSLEELERMVIPAWLLNSELSYKTMWIVSIDFKLTPNAAILSKRIKDSKNLTAEILAEAMIKLYHKSSCRISPNDNPEDIVLDETEWKILFQDVQISNSLQQQAIKLALKPVVNCETNLEQESSDQDNENFVVYISNIGNNFNLKRFGERRVAKKIVEACDIMEFTKHCRQYHFPKNQGGKYTFEIFLVVVNISAATIEAWETNLEQGLPDGSIVRSEKAELFF